MLSNSIRIRVRRSWFQFSARAFFLVLTVLCVWLGVRANRAHQQRQAVAAIGRLGGAVYYDYDNCDPNDFMGYWQGQSRVPAWLLASLGRDFFHDAVAVEMPHVDDREFRDQVTPAAWQQATAAAMPFLPGLPRLKDLYITGGQEINGALKHVAHLIELERLVIYNATHVTDEGVAHLRPLGSLRAVFLDNASIGDQSLEMFSRCPRLSILFLRNTQCTDAGLVHLRKMSQLKSLGIGGPRITDSGMTHLGALATLEYLWLQSPRVTEAGLGHLQCLTNLKVLALFGTYLGYSEVLEEALPNCQISCDPFPRD